MIKEQVEKLGDKIIADLHHGECFYNSLLLTEFLQHLDDMKLLAMKYYLQNKIEMEKEND